MSSSSQSLALASQNKLDGLGGDDTADALRYMVATKSREVRVVKLRGF